MTITERRRPDWPAARARQLARQGRLNGRLDGRADDEVCRPVDATGEELLGRAVTRFGLSASPVARELRVARTIADIAGVDGVEAPHVAEALQFRMSGRGHGGSGGC